ncbi:flagellar basal body P-ring protein FlgI [Agaribacter marinus]|uniref:Flagellar P-ring protein n=1 Tax=Agaribacter marinus TaxID=1431249 RepID=A0AA37WJA7_9ALTE|nr:flagellar basal body P-ring protein FlgI [Agaribacter marinus]GLR70009.1 flagellar P-ring protein [Agaribacter marinus]
MKSLRIPLSIFCCFLLLANASASSVRLKDLARIQGVQDNPLIGYGLVVGLSGTGDSNSNQATIQSLSNTLQSFNLIVDANQIKSRNVAAVMVTASLPAYAQSGDTLEVNVSSIGDARSLQGGTLLLTPLEAANGDIYALAQGPLSVGGYRFDFNGNRVQKNHPTVGVVPNGANVEKSIDYHFDIENSGLTLVLNEPDFTTAQRIIDAISTKFPSSKIESNHPGKINLQLSSNQPLMQLMSKIESIEVRPDNFARVVINERNGTVVAGAGVRIDDVVISHGELKLRIETEFSASQPNGFFRQTGESIGSLVIANSDIEVTEGGKGEIHALPGASIGELVDALKALNLSTRDLISVLQAIKQSGALHAELIIQ